MKNLFYIVMWISGIVSVACLITPFVLYGLGYGLIYAVYSVVICSINLLVTYVLGKTLLKRIK